MQRGEARKRQWIKRRINRNHSCCSYGSVWSAAGRGEGLSNHPMFQTASKVKMKKDIVESLANTSSRVAAAAAALGGEGRRRRRRAPNLYCRELLFFYQTEGGEKGFLSLYVFGNGRLPPPSPPGAFLFIDDVEGQKKRLGDGRRRRGGHHRAKKGGGEDPSWIGNPVFFVCHSTEEEPQKCHHFRNIKHRRLF